MTSIRYTLFEKRSEGEVTTFVGLAPDGERVMVHFLPGAAERSDRLLRRLESLPSHESGRVRRRDRVDDAPVLVTDVLRQGSLEAWLRAAEPDAGSGRDRAAARRPGPGGAGSERAAPEGARSADGPGDFTRLFILGEAGPEEGGPEEAGPEEGGPVDAESGEGREPGEFTRLFLRDEVPGGDAPAPGEDAPEAGAGPSVEPADAEEEASPPSSPEREPPPPRPEPPPPPAPSRPETSERPPGGERRADDAGAPEEPGQFTRLFGGGDDLASQPDREYDEPLRRHGPGPDDDDYLDRLTGRPEEPEAPEPESADPPRDPPPAPGPSRPRGPSRYTQIIRGGGAGGHAAGGSSPPSSPSRDAGASSPAREAGTSSPAPGSGSSGTEPSGEGSGGSGKTWPYVVALVAIVLVALGIVLFFGLRGGESVDVPEDAPPVEEVVEPGGGPEAAPEEGAGRGG